MPYSITWMDYSEKQRTEAVLSLDVVLKRYDSLNALGREAIIYKGDKEVPARYLRSKKEGQLWLFPEFS